MPTHTLVIPPEMDGWKLRSAAVNGLLSQPGKLAEIGANAAAMAIPDANRRIAEEILSLLH